MLAIQGAAVAGCALNYRGFDVKTKTADQVVPGDKIEAASGVFVVTQAINGLGGAIHLRGTVGGVRTAWGCYDPDQRFEMVTVH